MSSSQLIWVRALPDRIAYTAPKGGRRIPSDQYIQVPPGPWITRLLTVHGDIEQKPETASAPVAVEAPTPLEVPPEAVAPKRRAAANS